MRCARCKKKFDEEKYSGICPKCGYFNNQQTEYDVNRYISARFDGDDKVSTGAQGARQHEQLHQMYDSQDMHKAGAGSHEKLHEMYDRYDMHGQTAKTAAPGPAPLPGNRQPPRSNALPGKPNPYQSAMPGNPYQAGSAGAFRPGNVQKTGQPGTSGQGRAYQAGTSGQAKAQTGEKRKNIVTPICIVVAVLAIAVTVIACQLKRQKLEDIYFTLEFEKETAQAGELFELSERLLIVDKARVVDTSGLEGLPKGEKLVAVGVEILPAEEQGSDDTSGEVYVSDGTSYKTPLDQYTVVDLLYDGDYSREKEVLSQYSFYGYIPEDGKKGECYFFVDEDAEEISISFDEEEEKDGLYVLQRRVSVALQIEEGDV